MSLNPVNEPNKLKPKMDIGSPAIDEVLPSGTPLVHLSATLVNFSLGYSDARAENHCVPSNPPGGRGGGQYIYVAIDKGTPLRIDEIPEDIPTHGALVDGPHVLRAFLVMTGDEAMKDGVVPPGTLTGPFFCVRNFYVGSNAVTSTFDANVPLLTLISPVRPQDFVYPYNEVLLDFYVLFGDLSSSGYKVKVKILDDANQVVMIGDTDPNGIVTLTSWQPYCIQGLEGPQGGDTRQYTLCIWLVDAGDNLVHNGPDNLTNLNDITQIFSVHA